MVSLSKIMAAIIVVVLIIAGLYFFIGSQNKPATVSTVNWQQAQPLIHSGMPVKYQNVTVNGHSFTIAIQLMTPDGHIFSNSVIDEEVGVMFISNGSRTAVQFKVSLESAYANNTQLQFSGLAKKSSYYVNNSEYVLLYSGMGISTNATLPAQENATVSLLLYSFYSPYMQNYVFYRFNL